MQRHRDELIFDTMIDRLYSMPAADRAANAPIPITLAELHEMQLTGLYRDHYGRRNVPTEDLLLLGHPVKVVGYAAYAHG